MELLDRIAQATLYEGYVLWPYRRSAVKNRQRWTFGGVYPPAYSASSGGTDVCRMQTQCLIATGMEARLDVSVRFLHVVKRQGAELIGDSLDPVDELEVAGRRHLSWDEASERTVQAPPITIRALAKGYEMPVDIAGGEDVEWLEDESGRRGALVRSWEPLSGSIRLSAEHLGGRLHRLTVRIDNTSRWPGTDREEAVRRTMVSTHTALKAAQGGFISSVDPPDGLAVEVERCENVGTWPVLVGEPPDDSVVLSSPIIMYDYPKVAPESPGDTFDGGEIDQLLILNTLSLTDEEKREMAATDPRTRLILERTESLSEDELMRLHGTIRERGHLLARPGREER